MMKLKAIIPVAGVGTRLRPHTHTTPKALLYVAGKPIIAHILDRVTALGIDEIVLIIGYMGEKIAGYVRANYPALVLRYVEQKEMRGLGHAVYLTKDLVGTSPALIIYGDTIFEGDLRGGLDNTSEGAIGVKRVEDPRRFGVVKVSENGRIIDLVEKPETFVSDLAIVGVNYINNTPLLFDSLAYIQKHNITTKDEYQLTDAFKVMVDRGADLRTFPMENWFDCGKPEALLEANRHLLSRQGLSDRMARGSIVIPPSFIDESAQVYGSIVGPWVSIAGGVRVENSIVRDSILGENAVVESCLLEGSLVGNNAFLKGSLRKVNVGDSSEVDFQ